MRSADELIFVGTYGYVAAVDKVTGAERWRTSLPGTGYSIVTLLFEDGVLYAASGGRLFAINPLNGDIAWENALKGLGSSAVCLATTRSSANAGRDPIPQHHAEQAARAASSSSHTSATT